MTYHQLKYLLWSVVRDALRHRGIKEEHLFGDAFNLL
jgi:hypothetical protein